MVERCFALNKMDPVSAIGLEVSWICLTENLRRAFKIRTCGIALYLMVKSNKAALKENNIILCFIGFAAFLAQNINLKDLSSYLVSLSERDSSNTVKSVDTFDFRYIS